MRDLSKGLCHVEGINGKDLYLAGIQQAKSLETKIEKEEVLKIEKIRKQQRTVFIV